MMYETDKSLEHLQGFLVLHTPKYIIM